MLQDPMPSRVGPVVVLVHGLAAGPRGVEFHIHRERHRRRQPVLRAVFSADVVACAVQAERTRSWSTRSTHAWGAWTRLAGTRGTPTPAATSDGDGHVLCAASAGGNFFYTISTEPHGPRPAKGDRGALFAPAAATSPREPWSAWRAARRRDTWSVSAPARRVGAHSPT